jgi:HAD superfamily hydrolase (TIGR01509 family)
MGTVMSDTLDNLQQAVCRYRRCVVIEDSHIGVRAARAAGMR